MLHFDQLNLGNPATEEAIKLGTWTVDKRFVKQEENLEACEAEDLKSIISIIQQLFRCLKFLKSTRVSYTVLRSTGPARVFNSRGPAYLVPIRIITGAPAITSTRQGEESTRQGGKESKWQVVIGQAIYITEPVLVGPMLDFVIIAT